MSPINKSVVEATGMYNYLSFFKLIRKYDISVFSPAFFAMTHTSITRVLNLNTVT